MKFMILRKADANTEAGVMPSNELLTAMGSYNQAMMEAGVMKDGVGLKPSREGVRVSFKDGQPLVTDGPFGETKELLAGFSMIETATKEEAIEWVKRWPREDGDVTLELRPLFELSDFEPGDGIDLIEDQFQRLVEGPAQVNTYLDFNGNCREALAFYEQVLGAKVEMLMPFRGSPMAEGMPEQYLDLVLHTRFRVGHWQLMASDATPERYQKPQGFHVTLNYTDPGKARTIYDALVEGGQATMPFTETAWALGFGMLVDRFGIPWMINCEKPQP
ncbi:YciI family protein [Gallaecimonas kandeliae]|uniref:YciI family protein n=1 Tax=Gallaecimonas kandeliae TaxID=3029055 RepID=UPI00264A16E9|nr:YciI family protein [Gallaecimonas kandeliae]WKE64807.1 YciI family protein [Gallaecimonas kandeliae]